jgi:hypothetical protein
MCGSRIMNLSLGMCRTMTLRTNAVKLPSMETAAMDWLLRY